MRGRPYEESYPESESLSAAGRRTSVVEPGSSQLGRGTGTFFWRGVNGKLAFARAKAYRQGQPPGDGPTAVPVNKARH